MQRNISYGGQIGREISRWSPRLGVSSLDLGRLRGRPLFCGAQFDPCPGRRPAMLLSAYKGCRSGDDLRGEAREAV